jgi:chromate reductase
MLLMSTTPRILVFSCSTRRGSFNHMLAKLAAESARSAGAEVEVWSVREHPLPLYDADLEEQQGLPAGVKRLKELMRSHHGFLFASPEHNSTISAPLKNALDWASRAEGEERPLVCFAGKVAGLMAASPGALGGLRGLVALRAMLGNVKVIVLPEQVTLSRANEAFAEDGSFKEAAQQKSVHALATALVRTCTRLND